MSICVPVQHCLHKFRFMISLKLGSVSSYFIFFKIVLSILGPLHFHVSFRVNLLIYSDIQLGL